MRSFVGSLALLILLVAPAMAEDRIDSQFPDYKDWTLVLERSFVMMTSNDSEDFVSSPYVSAVHWHLNLGTTKQYADKNPASQRVVAVDEVFGKVVLRAMGSRGACSPELAQLLVNGKWQNVVYGTLQVYLVDAKAFLHKGEMKGVRLQMQSEDGTYVETMVKP